MDIAPLLGISPAISAAVGGSVSAYVSYFLSTMKAEKDARRDYEYGALKRLYQEYEPLVFQLHGSCEKAYGRITNLAQNLKRRRLNIKGDGPLNNNDTYLINTIYYLLVPLAIFKLMERRLTLFDLEELDDRFKNEYLLAKALYHVLRRDCWFADQGPKIEGYDPYNREISKTMRKEHPEKYRSQAIHSTDIDRMAEALRKEESPGRFWVMSIDEFTSLYQKEKKEEEDTFSRISGRLKNFHPATSPVLWKILMAYAYICKAIYTFHKKEKLKTILEGYSVPIDDSAFYWYSYEEANNLDDVEQKSKKQMPNITSENLKIAKKYVLDNLRNRHSSD
jgi:hypothetical protein